MSTVTRPANPESNPRVVAVFNAIRATRNSSFTNNLWDYLANDPALLESAWRNVKAVMAAPSNLGRMTKELIYAAVSIANNCANSIHSHPAAAHAHDRTDAQRAEFLSIVSPAGRTNHLLNGMPIPSDPKFNRRRQT